MKKTSFIYYLIMLLPVIDLITSIQTRLSIVSLSFGMLIKSLFILVVLYYVIFKSNNKYHKYSILYLLLIFIYVMCYFAFKSDLLSFGYLRLEIQYLCKIFFFPIMFLGFVNYFVDYGFDKKRFIKAMIISLSEYILFLLIPLMLNCAFDSYTTGLHGYVGWYYAANEVSVIIVLLLPFMYYLLNNTQKYNFLVALPIIYAITAIGTKVSFIGTLCVTFLTMIFMIIKNKGKINNYTIGTFFVLILSISFLVVFNNVTVENVQILAENQNFEFIKTASLNSNNEEVSSKIPTINEKSNSEFIKKLTKFLLSNRDLYYYQTKDIFETNYSWDYSLFGMGFSNTGRINNPNIDKLIEIDYLDLYYHTGVIGLLTNCIPLLYLFIKIVKFLFSKKINLQNICFIFYNSLMVCMAMSIAAIAGHVLYYPAVSIYLVFYIVFILNEMNCFDKKALNEKKISILALHLNYGGIENVLSNQANMLSKNYELEIVTLYNNHKNPAFALNKNIKVIYLMDTISNKDAFKKALKKFNIIKIITEGFKAIKILFLKPLLLKNYILNSDAKVIISTRKEFSYLLGKYARKGVVTISEEHNHHDNNKEFIKSVIKCNKNVDYLLPTSKELCEFFGDKVKAKVEYIPNALNYYPPKKNNLKSNKIVAIGRLSPEKGFKSLVEVMNLVVKKNKNIVLDIYGDGEEKAEILDLIKINNLSKNINLKGFVKIEDLRKQLVNYSIVLNPSYKESFGLAVLEAMSFGMPCICFDSAKGPLEFVNEETGIVIENRDANKMANEIVKLLSDKIKLNKLSDNCIKISKNYSIDSVTPLFNNFISDAVKISASKEKRVMFISSTGGHLNELLQLKKLFNKYNYCLITEKTKTNKNLKNKYVGRLNYLIYGTKHYPIPYFLYILPFNCFLSLIYYIKYRPKVIISTGAHTAGPMCCIGKIFGSKIVYIETFANSHTKTATGRIIYKFADLFIVQWESMLELYPDAVFGGWIY